MMVISSLALYGTTSLRKLSRSKVADCHCFRPCWLLSGQVIGAGGGESLATLISNSTPLLVPTGVTILNTITLLCGPFSYMQLSFGSSTPHVPYSATPNYPKLCPPHSHRLRYDGLRRSPARGN